MIPTAHLPLYVEEEEDAQDIGDINSLSFDDSSDHTSAAPIDVQRIPNKARKLRAPTHFAIQTMIWRALQIQNNTAAPSEGAFSRHADINHYFGTFHVPRKREGKPDEEITVRICFICE